MSGQLKAITILCYILAFTTSTNYVMAFHGIPPSVHVSTDGFQYLVGQPILITVTYVHPAVDTTTPHVHSVVLDVFGVTIASWNTASGLSKTVVWGGTQPGAYPIRACSFRVSYSVSTQEDCDQKQVTIVVPPKEVPPTTSTVIATVTSVAPPFATPGGLITTIERTLTVTYATLVSDSTVGYGLVALALGIVFAGLVISRSLSRRRGRG